MKRILLISFAIFAVLVTAALIVPFLVPADVYKAQIEKSASNALQREVKLSGDVNISVFPRFSASVEGVQVANPEGFSADNMITAEALRGSVKWLPLLSRRVEVQELAFENATVSLERLADGRANWELGGKDKPPNDGNDKTGQSFKGGIEQARLVNANVSYRDAVSGAAYDLGDFTAEASMRAPDQPLRAKGKGIFQDRAFNFTVSLASPQAAMDGAATPARFSFDSDIGKASYDGNLSLGDAPQLDGKFQLSSDALDALASFANLDLPLDLARLGKVTGAGHISGAVGALTIKELGFTQRSDLADTTFNGGLTLGPAPTIQGALNIDAPNLAEAARFAGVDMPFNLAPLGAGKIKAQLSGPLSKPDIRFESLQLSGDLLEALYTGAITLGDTPVLDGTLKATLSDAGDLAKAMGIDVPARDALDRLELNAHVKGPATSLELSNIGAIHDGPLLKAAYTGDIKLGGTGSLNGKITASSNQLRALLDAAKVKLAPGETLRKFALDTDVSGNFKQIEMPGMTLELDDINATGSSAIDLRPQTPVISATLAMPELNLTPFLGDGKDAPETKTQGWSKTQFDLAGLKAINANLNLKAGEIIIGKTQLTDTDLVTSLQGGRMTANLNRFNAFGGAWSGKLILNAQDASKPLLSFNMTGDSILASQLLNTFAGFDRLTGRGQFTLKGSASGNSMDALMQGLNGEMKANLANGALKGINIAKLVRSADSLQSALRNGSLQSLDFSQVLSPQTETDFTEFATAITIKNGVADVDLLKLLNPVLGLDGTGRINLAGQNLDLRLATSIDTHASGTGSVVQLNGIPVPIRLSGSWNNLKLTPDMSGVQDALVAEASGRVRDEITGRIGDQLGGDGGAVGGLISDALGIPRGEDSPAPEEARKETPPPADTDTADEASPPPAEDTTEPESEPEEEPQTLEDTAGDLARDALGDIFGRKKD